MATLILARLVTPTELGVYGVGFTSLRLVRSIQEGLTIQPLNALGAALEPRPFARYATATSLIQGALGLAAGGLAALVGWGLTAQGNDTAGPALFALWFPFLVWQWQEYLRRLLYARGDVAGAVFNSALANVVRLGVMVWWAARGGLTGIAGLQAIAWGSLAALIPGLWQTRAYWARDFMDLRQAWRQNWDFGRWVLGGALANWVSVEFYPILTAGMISFAAAGAYRALQNLAAPIHLLLRAVDNFLTPRAARSYALGGQAALRRALRLTYVFAGLPIFAILVISVVWRDFLLQALYGDTYLEYSEGMLLMALFYGLWFAYWPLQTAFKALQLSRPIFIANLGAIAVMFSLGIMAIRAWGVYGTIVGQALNALVVGMILLWSWRRIISSGPAKPEQAGEG
ncbi:MAG TPA: oligosaccharide flippase family protein [Anaerolineales bacterium]|nr:oligosaccharide flippase family protein [Anaerolineales bacterium]